MSEYKNDEDDDDKVTRTEGEPNSRLTQLTAEMTAVLDEPGRENVRAIVMLSERVGTRIHNGLQLYGYEDDVEAMAELFFHLQAIFRASGRDLRLMVAKEDGSIEEVSKSV